LQIGGAGQPLLSRCKGEFATAVPFLVWLTFLAVFVPEGRKNSRHSTVAEPGLRGAGQWPRLVQGGRFCAACRILRRCV